MIPFPCSSLSVFDVSVLLAAPKQNPWLFHSLIALFIKTNSRSKLSVYLFTSDRLLDQLTDSLDHCLETFSILSKHFRSSFFQLAIIFRFSLKHVMHFLKRNSRENSSTFIKERYFFCLHTNLKTNILLVNFTKKGFQFTNSCNPVFTH